MGWPFITFETFCTKTLFENVSNSTLFILDLINTESRKSIKYGNHLTNVTRFLWLLTIFWWSQNLFFYGSVKIFCVLKDYMSRNNRMIFQDPSRTLLNIFNKISKILYYRNTDYTKSENTSFFFEYNLLGPSTKTILRS